MYRSEAIFSKTLCSQLVEFHQRIESGETGAGIPDLYIRFKFTECWVELKNHKYLSVKDKSWTIRWRKGQQAWALKYRQASMHSRCTYTAVAMSDGYIVIPMVRRYFKNIVQRSDVFRMTKLGDVIDVLRKECKV